MAEQSWDELQTTAEQKVRERSPAAGEDMPAGHDDEASARMAAAQRPLRVLVVDDNRDLAYMMAALIEKCGHEVRIAYDGPAALEIATAFHPDVLLVDIALPGMDGFCVARELRRPGVVSDFLLIAVTGYADEAHHALGMKAGFDHYVPKPVAFRTLSELLLLARNRLVRSVEKREAAREGLLVTAG